MLIMIESPSSSQPGRIGMSAFWIGDTLLALMQLKGV
jgi:hypothetical protein